MKGRSESYLQRKPSCVQDPKMHIRSEKFSILLLFKDRDGFAICSPLSKMRLRLASCLGWTRAVHGPCASCEGRLANNLAEELVCSRLCPQLSTLLPNSLMEYDLLNYSKTYFANERTLKCMNMPTSVSTHILASPRQSSLSTSEVKASQPRTRVRR